VWTPQTVFVCALMLLGRSEQSFPTVQFIEKAPAPVSPSAEAYVLTDENRVVLITSSWAFRVARAAQDRCGRVQALQQIAGVLARRIVFNHKPGEMLVRGQRVGLIKFGSRTDVIFPQRAEIKVKAGDRVMGGATILARVPVAPKAGPDRMRERTGAFR